jgi:short-subunit dehydrogenase
MYNATKFGLRGFGSGLRQDLHGTGVGVSVVMPGFVSEAGMFADSGMELPRVARLVTPDQVAAGVVRAVVRDKGEVVVAPLEMRASARLGQLAPGLNAAVQRRAGAADIVADHRGGS